MQTVMDVKRIAKEISELMFPEMEVGASDYVKISREKLVNIIETTLNNIIETTLNNNIDLDEV